MVDSTEVQYDAIALGEIRLCPVAPVPQILIVTQNASDAGQLAFRREGDEYFTIPLIRLPLTGSREGIVPQTVEIDKRCAPHLRTRIFRKYIVLVELFAPLSKHGRPSDHININYTIT